MPALEERVKSLIKDSRECEREENVSIHKTENSNGFLSEINFFWREGQKIENDWDCYVKTVSSEKTKIKLKRADRVLEDLKKILSIENKGKFKEDLKELASALTYYRNCIADAIEFEKITSEMLESRSISLKESRIEEARDILSSL